MYFLVFITLYLKLVSCDLAQAVQEELTATINQKGEEMANVVKQHTEAAANAPAQSQAQAPAAQGEETPSTAG